MNHIARASTALLLLTAAGCASAHETLDAGVDAAPSDAGAMRADVTAVDAPPGLDASLDDAAPATDAAPIVGPSWAPRVPLSGARVGATPQLRIRALAGTVGSASVDICGDALCHDVRTTFGSVTTSIDVTTPLDPGLYFWRAVGTDGTPSATWTFRVVTSSVSVRPHPFTDVDGDGYADVVYTDGTLSVRFLRGGPSMPELPGTLIPLGATSMTLHAVGDVDGDGLADIADADGYVHPGTPAGPRPHPSLSFALLSPASAVAGVGDLDGDGNDDVVLDQAGPGACEAYLVPGGAATGFHPLPFTDCVVPGALDADLNGNGTLDFLVGRPSMDRVEAFDGADPAGAAIASWTGAPGMLFGLHAIGVGDADGDGLPDIVVARGNAPGVDFRGSTGATWFVDTPIEPGTAPSVAAIGDFDLDGHDDFLVQGNDVRIVFGDGASVVVTGVGSPMPGAFSAAGPGDLNGDGAPDVVVGLHDFAPPGDGGTVRIVFGGTRAPTWIDVPADPAGYFVGLSVAGR